MRMEVWGRRDMPVVLNADGTFSGVPRPEDGTRGGLSGAEFPVEDNSRDAAMRHALTR